MSYCPRQLSLNSCSAGVSLRAEGGSEPSLTSTRKFKPFLASVKSGNPLPMVCVGNTLNPRLRNAFTISAWLESTFALYLGIGNFSRKQQQNKD